ncbi:MAG: hypothetical protein K2Y08_04940, partial [Alphaproteobacteria bacterium]|nr:hypothetical protein [Alphaproteobacteria bacterium]
MKNFLIFKYAIIASTFIFSNSLQAMEEEHQGSRMTIQGKEKIPDLHGRMPGDRNYGSTMSEAESEMYERRPDLHGRMPGDRNYGSTMSEAESEMYERRPDLHGRMPGDRNYGSTMSEAESEMYERRPDL